MDTPASHLQVRAMRIGGAADVPAMEAVRSLAPRFTGVLALARFVLVLGTIALGVKAVVKSRERAGILEHWVPVTATVRRCAVDRYLPLHRSEGSSDGVNLSITCELAFLAGGQEYVSRIAPPPVDVGTHRWDATQPGYRGVDADLETSIESWVSRHRPGSAVSVRYDPVHLPALSVVGSGTPLDFDPVPGAWRGSAVFAALTILVSLAISYMRRLKQPTNAT